MREQKQSTEHSQHPAPPFSAPAVNTNAQKASRAGCVGAEQGNLSCEAIATKATYDQARDADKQVWVGVAQAIGLVVSLILSAIAARAAFGAVRETEKGAQASREAVDEARRANEIAQTALHRGSRPWVGVTMDSLESVDREDTGSPSLRFRFNFLVQTYGNEPAGYVMIHLHSHGAAGGGIRPDIFNDVLRKNFESTPGHKTGRTCFPNTTVIMPTLLNVPIGNLTSETLIKDQTLINSGGCAIYFYTAAGTWHITPIQFMILLHHDIDVSGRSQIPITAFNIRVAPFDSPPD